MILATWNVERLKHTRKLEEIIRACADTNADILVLTETDERIHLPYQYCWFTDAPGCEEVLYKPTERRVAIYTNYECAGFYDTFDPTTALCAELKTEKGNLLVYGTIMGTQGNRGHGYLQDLRMQIEDFNRLRRFGNLCIAGDYNCSFSDNYYFTTEGRNMLKACFEECGIHLVTHDAKECVDHIAVTASFVGDVTVSEWNEKKTLSDHKGIAVRI